MGIPFVDLGSPILAAFGRPSSVVRTRRAAGAYDATTGLWVSGAATDAPRSMVVQPARARDIAQLPEGERARESIVLFDTEAILTSEVSESKEADVIAWSGRRWAVRVVDDWQAQAGYTRAVAVRLEA